MDPEGRCPREVKQVAIANCHLVRYFGMAAIEGVINGLGGIVDTKPEDSPDFVGQPGAHLCHERERGLLRGDGPFVAISYRVELVGEDRKSTRLNSSHVRISYAVFCLKKKKRKPNNSKEHNQKHHTK